MTLCRYPLESYGPRRDRSRPRRYKQWASYDDTLEAWRGRSLDQSLDGVLRILDLGVGQDYRRGVRRQDSPLVSDRLILNFFFSHVFSYSWSRRRRSTL